MFVFVYKYMSACTFLCTCIYVYKYWNWHSCFRDGVMSRDVWICIFIHICIWYHVTWVMTHMKDSCHIRKCTFACESCHLWMSHVPNEWVMSHMHNSWSGLAICESVKSVDWMCHTTYEWVMSHMKESCPMSHMKESCPICLSHGPMLLFAQ